MADNLTMGRPTIPALACSDSQLRRAVAELQGSLASIGNPAYAGRNTPPIAAEVYPGTFLVDFELLSNFSDTNAMGMKTAMACVLKPTGSPADDPGSGDPDAPHPLGSPLPAAIIEVCAPATITHGQGDIGTATYRKIGDDWCWFPFSWPLDPGGAGGTTCSDVTYQVVGTGFADNSCGDCSTLNATFTMNYTEAPSSNASFSPCTFSGSGCCQWESAGFSLCTDVGAYTFYWDFWLCPNGANWDALLALTETNGDFTIYWKKLGVAGGGLSGVSITFDVSDYCASNALPCNDTSASMTVSAV